MLELNHGHIVTVASSLGLFSTAGVEVSIIHNSTYTSHRSHHPKPALSSKALSVPASTLGRGRLGPLSLVVPPPVKLRDTHEHWGASYRFLYLQQWGCRAPIGLWLRGQNELTAPQGTETSSSLLCEQRGAHSVFSSWQLSMDKVLVVLPIVFLPRRRFLFVILMHIQIFCGIVYLHNHRGSQSVALPPPEVLIWYFRERVLIFGWGWCHFQSVCRATTPFVFVFIAARFAFVVRALIRNDRAPLQRNWS